MVGVRMPVLVEPNEVEDRAGPHAAELAVLAGLDTDDVLVEVDNALPASLIWADFANIVVS